MRCRAILLCVFCFVVGEDESLGGLCAVCVCVCVCNIIYINIMIIDLIFYALLTHPVIYGNSVSRNKEDEKGN